MLAEKNMELTYFGSQVQWTPMTTKQRAKRVILLWMEINEKAKEKFGERYGSAKSNEWVVLDISLEVVHLA